MSLGAAVTTGDTPAAEANEPPPPPPLRLHPSTPSMPLPSFVSRSPATPGSNQSFFGRIFVAAAVDAAAALVRHLHANAVRRRRPPRSKRAGTGPTRLVVSLDRGDGGGRRRLLQAAPLDSQSFSTNTHRSGAVLDIVTAVKLSPTASLAPTGHSSGGARTSPRGSAPRVVSVTYRVGDMARVDVREGGRRRREHRALPPRRHRPRPHLPDEARASLCRMTPPRPLRLPQPAPAGP